ncbi:hypothetical protein JCM1841_006598 [Sporobolomyces salmonicolor]
MISIDAQKQHKHHVLLVTLHNSVHVYDLCSRLSPPVDPSSSSSPLDTPILSPVLTLHAPARPLLWAARFSQSRYASSASSAEEREPAAIRLAGGSLLGDVLVWNMSSVDELLRVLEETGEGTAHQATHQRTKVGELRRLEGHRGAIFALSFSPSSRYLASGSDDRTIRIWDLTKLSLSSSSRPEQASAEPATLWGHEGRVWRVDWLDETTLTSVAEDATCRLWAFQPPGPLASFAPPAPSRLSRPHSSAPLSPNSHPYTLLSTFRNGHDGRSIWSVASCSLPGELDEGEARERRRKALVTGGADGGVRCWFVQDDEENVREKEKPNVAMAASRPHPAHIKAFTIAVDADGEQFALTLTTGGSFYYTRTSLSESSASFRLSSQQPFANSPAFAGAACSLHLFLTSSTSNIAHAYAFSNRGYLLYAQLAVQSSRAWKDDGDSSVAVATGKKVEIELGVKAVFAVFDEARTRVAMWERAGWRVVVLDLGRVEGSEAEPSNTLPTILTSIPVAPLAGTAPTTFLFLTPELLLVGTASGSLSLYSLENDSCIPSPAPLAVATPHADGVLDLVVLSASEGRWTVETVGRDGLKCVVEVSVGSSGKTEIKVLDHRVIAKGPIERILASTDKQRKKNHYLALVDTRAAVFDWLGRQIVAFSSPGKQIPAQLVEDRKGAHFYRLVQGQLQRQFRPLPPRVPAPVLSPGLHGREIRAVQMAKINVDGKQIVLVATGAENGVLCISRLTHTNSLVPLYINRNLPSSLKSLLWTRNASHLFVCGTRELLCAFKIMVVPGEEEGSVELQVLPSGMVLAEEEGGEVRTMDIELLELENGEKVVAAGYSDGKLRLWRHDSSTAAFYLLAESEGLGKCTLTVLSSGINGLAVSVEGSILTVATAGDDNAVSIRRVKLDQRDSAGKVSVELGPSLTLPSAHGSTIQGLDFLSPSVLASSSVEQRLNVYALTGSPDSPRLELIESTCLDVADCSAQGILQLDDSASGAEGRRSWKVAVAGIGIQMLELEA